MDKYQIKYKILEEYIIKNNNDHYRLVYSYVKSKEDALDIIQESILKAFKAIEKQEDLEKLKPWFYRILINSSIDFIRKNKRVNLVDKEVLDQMILVNDDHKDLDLENSLFNLEKKYREIIILKYFKGFTIKEIADILKINENTIKTRLYKGLNLLKVSMEGEYFNEKNRRL